MIDPLYDDDEIERSGPGGWASRDRRPCAVILHTAHPSSRRCQLRTSLGVWWCTTVAGHWILAAGLTLCCWRSDMAESVTAN